MGATVLLLPRSLRFHEARGASTRHAPHGVFGGDLWENVHQ
jgi:hypothetical protein